MTQSLRRSLTVTMYFLLFCYVSPTYHVHVAKVKHSFERFPMRKDPSVMPLGGPTGSSRPKLCIYRNKDFDAHPFCKLIAHDSWSVITMFQVIRPRGDSCGCPLFCLESRSLQLIQRKRLSMKPSVRAVTGPRSARPWLVRGERGFDPAKHFVGFGTDVLEELWKNGKTANDDTSRKLHPTPLAKRGKKVALVGRFRNTPYIVSSNDWCQTGAINSWLSNTSPRTNLMVIGSELHGSKREVVEWQYTHRSPIANTPVVQSFFLNDICSVQIDGTGRIRIAKSDITLKTPLFL